MIRYGIALIVLWVTGSEGLARAEAQASPQAVKIAELRTRFDIFGHAKKGGVVAVELQMGDVIRRWTYGSGVTWDIGFFTRFTEKLDADAGEWRPGSEQGRPRLFVEMKELPDQLDVKAGVKAQVFLFLSDGSFQGFEGEQVFDTSRAGNLLELRPAFGTRPGAKAPEIVAGVKAAQAAKAPGVAGDQGGEQSRFYSRLWPLGSTVKVAFSGGTYAMRSQYKDDASEWMKEINLHLDFGHEVDRHDSVNGETFHYYDWVQTSSPRNIRFACHSRKKDFGRSSAEICPGPWQLGDEQH